MASLFTDLNTFEKNNMASTEQQDFFAFVADCERLLQQHGAPGGQFVGGTFSRDAFIYDTPGLKVVRSPDNALQINVRYLGEDGYKGDNPVIERNAKGEFYRTHGEWHYGRKRVQRLLAGETPQERITLGPGVGGWTAGLD